MADPEMSSDIESIIIPCSSLELGRSNFNTFMSHVRDGDIDEVVSAIKPEYLSMTDLNGFTPLHLACERGHLKLVRLFCLPSNIDTRDKYNNRPIHVACIFGYLEIIKCLHEEKCDIDAPGNFGNRPLHLAAKHGWLDVVKYLCSHNCQLDAPNDDDWRPIHFASIKWNAKIVQYLCDQGCNKESMTDCGDRPIQLACIYGQVEIVKLLCEQNCDIEMTTLDNYKPIHLACRHNHIAIVEYLCQKRCNIEAVDMFGYRPIHVAIENEHFDIIRLLCRHQCNIEVFTREGDSVFDLAIQNKNKCILEFLLDEKQTRQRIKKISNMTVECDVGCNHSFCFQSLQSIISDRKSIFDRGTFGCVYKMEDPELDYTFGVKIINKDRNATNQKAKHIEFNIKNYVDKIRHERIVQYFGIIDYDQNLYIFMEYVEGMSLNKHINKKPLPHNKLIQYSKEILEGLSFLHLNRIIHRDIKPENIMLTTEEHVKICDFGHSCYLESSEQRSQSQTEVSSNKMTVCGTPNYMAPELVTGKKYSYPVDIWGLGASVVHMLTGNPPFHGKESYTVIFKLGTKKRIKFVPPEPMSENMKSFVDKMICSPPSIRATAEVLLEFIRTNFESSTEQQEPELC